MLDQKKQEKKTTVPSQDSKSSADFEQLRNLYEELRIVKSKLPKRDESYTGYLNNSLKCTICTQVEKLRQWKEAIAKTDGYTDLGIGKERTDALCKAIAEFEEAFLNQYNSEKPNYCSKTVSEKFFMLFEAMGRCVGFPFRSKTQRDFLHRQLLPTAKGNLRESETLITRLKRLLPSEVMQEDSNDDLSISYALFYAHPLPVIEALLSYYPEWQLTHRNRKQEGILDHAVYHGNVEAAQLMISKMPEDQLPFCSQRLRNILSNGNLEAIAQQEGLPIHTKHADRALEILGTLQAFCKTPKENQQQQCLARAEAKPAAPLEQKAPSNPIKKTTWWPGFFFEKRNLLPTIS